MLWFDVIKLKEANVYLYIYIISGVCLMVCGGPLGDGGPTRALIRDHFFESSTLVKLCELDEQLIDSYVATGEPLLVFRRNFHNVFNRYNITFYSTT